MPGILASLCGAVAFVEVVMSHAKRRSVNVVLVGTALTACAILSVAMSVRMIPYLFHSLSAAFRGSVNLAISLGPPCCLAAATWIGRRTLDNWLHPVNEYMERTVWGFGVGSREKSFGQRLQFG